ncbi:MAG: DJ-1 family glyoxalase III [Candidatus Omnitrophota bacterium]
MRKKVWVLLADGFEEIEAVVCIDILRRAGLEVITVCVGKEKIVCGSQNVKIFADLNIEEVCVLPDALVVPGGTRGSENLANSKKVLNIVKDCYNKGKIVAAICAAPAIVLLPAGILEGKKVTSYPDYKEKFAGESIYADKDVVVDANIITSRGVGTVFAFAFKITEILQGKEVCKSVKEDVLLS